jgi:hypothetical protein
MDLVENMINKRPNKAMAATLFRFSQILLRQPGTGASQKRKYRKAFAK